MSKEKLYKESKKFTIYCNYGVLGAEKRIVFTYGATAETCCCEKIMVRLPENDCFGIYETVMGEMAVEAAWGYQYDINDVLQGDKKPCLFALDNEGKGHRVYLDILEQGEE